MNVPDAKIQALILQHDLGDVVTKLQLDSAEINLTLIERLKQEVDFQVRRDVRLALRLAEFTGALAADLADPQAHALSARAQAIALHLNGRYVEAYDQYTRAQVLHRQSGQEIEAARVGRALVDVLMYLGRYEEALQVAAEARAVFLAHNETLLAAQLETNVGNLHHRLDQYQEALACYDRARAVFTAAQDQNALALIAYNSANIYSNLDDFRQAQTLYEQAEELYGAQGRTQAALHAKYSLGYLYFLKGQYHQAMRVLHETRAAAELDGDDWLRALCELDLAELYLQLHAHAEAAQMATQARERFLQLAMRYEAAKALTWLGLARLQQQRQREAEELLLTAQAEFAAEGNAVYQGLLDLYLAELALQRGTAAEARELAARAQQRFAQESLKTKTYYAQLVLARAMTQAGDPAEARALAEQTLALCEGLGAPWLTQQAHELLGDLQQAAGDTARAYEHYTQAVACVERIRGSIRVDEFRSAFFQRQLSVYEKLIRLCLTDGSADKRAEAFYYLESRKARTLVDMLVNELEQWPESGGELHDRWRQLREELHWYYSAVNQTETRDQRRRLVLPDTLRAEIQTREQALAELARQAQLRDPHFDWLHNLAGVTVPELQAVLAADEALIEYYFDGDELKIFVIDRDDVTVSKGGRPRGELQDLVFELKFQIEKFGYGAAYFSAHHAQLLESAQGVLRELYEALFASVAERVAGRKLIFIPFDALHNVPFQALYDGREYLLDRHEISCAPSARLYALAASQPAYAPQRTLIVGAPDAVAPQISNEVDALCQLFPQADCLTGAAATLAQVTQAAPASDLIHIAAHGVFRQDNPLFSALKLADGWLNFYDICALRLRAPLVVLSGCNTGAQQVYVGDEALGLARGFMTAGAASLVVSLWAVHDQATAQLMTFFYTRLQEGVAARTALWDAARAVRQAYPHPYFWAPFVLLGRS